jgi:hypothetical protein
LTLEAHAKYIMDNRSICCWKIPNFSTCNSRTWRMCYVSWARMGFPSWSC